MALSTQRRQDNDDMFLLGSLTVSKLHEDTGDQWQETLQVNGHNVHFKQDTGSNVNILPNHVLKSWIAQATCWASEQGVSQNLPEVAKVPPSLAEIPNQA